MNKKFEFFYQQLQFYRERKKLSKSKLGNLIEKSASYIRLLENHKYTPPTYNICQQLGLILELSPLEIECFYRAAFIERLGTNIEFYEQLYNAIPSIKHSRPVSQNETISSALISIADINKEIIYVNDTFHKVTGFNRKEVIGKTHSILKSGYHSSEFFKNLHYTVTKGHIWQSKIRNKSKNQKTFNCNMEIVPIKSQSGNIEKYIGIQNLIQTF